MKIEISNQLIECLESKRNYDETIEDVIWRLAFNKKKSEIKYGYTENGDAYLVDNEPKN